MVCRLEKKGSFYQKPCKECKWHEGHKVTCSVYKKWCKEMNKWLGLKLSDMSSVQRVKGAHELLQESKVSKLFSLLIDDDNK